MRGTNADKLHNDITVAFLRSL